MLLARVAETIRRHQLLQTGQRAGVAVSGGADSVCLLHVLLALAPEWDLRLHVLHLNHQLRGEESDADERFVRDLALRMAVPISVRTVDVAAVPDNLEQAARRARLEFFREQMSTGLDCVAVGHTRTDQAETVLFRLLRGAGGDGLAAIRPKTTYGIVRPLLDVHRQEVEQFLRDRAIPWRTDSSNSSPEFARNRIRHQLLPQLAREWNPAIGETLARTADWAQAEEEYWRIEMDRLAACHFRHEAGAIVLSANELGELPLAVARRLVRRALQQTRGDLRGLDFRHIEAVVRLAEAGRGHGSVQLPGLEVTRSLDWLRFSPAGRPEGYQLHISVPGVVPLPFGSSLSLELIENSETIRPAESVYNGRTGLIDWCALSGSLQIRNWRPGDRYQPWGSSGVEKVKCLFQKARIPRWERYQWPVITGDQGIVWVKQFGPAACFAAGPGSGVVLRIQEIALDPSNSESGARGRRL